MTTPIEQDERLGLPSASSADIFMRCRGAFNLIKKLGIVKKESKAMADGTKIHLALETHNYEGLTKSQAITADRIAEKEAKVFEKYSLDGANIIREQRMWIEHPFAGKLFSAKPDVVYLKGDTCVSINYKTGFSEQKDIEESWQITSELACVSRTEHWKGIGKAIGILISPNAPTMKYQEITYSAQEVESKAAEVEAAMIHALEADPNDEDNFVSGELQCHWCPAKAVCPRHAGKIDGSVAKLDAIYAEIYEQKMVEKIDAATPDQRGVMYADLTMVEGVIKKAKTYLKELTTKREVSGYIMKPSKSVEIINKDEALRLANDAGILKEVQDIRLTDLDKKVRSAFEKTLVEAGAAQEVEESRMTKVKNESNKKGSDKS